MRRIADEQLERALGELSEAERGIDRGVHSVRKRLKKLRGLLRLLEGAMGREAFAEENACFRDAGRLLAGPRRAAASLAALEALHHEYPGVLLGESRALLRAALNAERDRALELLREEDRTVRAAELLAGARARLPAWPIRHAGWATLSSGFRTTYGRGRRAFRQAGHEPTTEQLHEWRKHAKYHWYHVRLLSSIWPGPMAALSETLETLTEELGTEHDLDDLRLTLLERAPPDELRGATAHVLELIQTRRQTLRQLAIARGQQVFAERPSAITTRFRAYFSAWLSEPGIGSRRAGGADDSDA
ncbi:MAG: CHAD domain-containing protein [Myxococcales bacterium]|nr:CHAD domain-containing protein [Myxococcales bacterium]